LPPPGACFLALKSPGLADNAHKLRRAMFRFGTQFPQKQTEIAI